MIPTRDRLINMLMATIYADSKDKTIIRISMDNVLKILANNDYLVPNRMYEMKVEELLTSKMVGKYTIDPSLKYIIAKAMLDLADTMAIDQDTILKYNKYTASDIMDKK